HYFDNARPHAKELNEVLFAMERQSEHPLAGAIVNFLQPSTLGATQLDNFQSITGKGVSASYKGIQYLAGNRKLLQDYNIIVDEQMLGQATLLQEGAQTLIYFAKEQSVLGFVTIADKIKQNSAAAITALKRNGVAVFML